MKDFNAVLRIAPLREAVQRWSAEEGIDPVDLSRIYNMLDSIRFGRIEHKNPQQRPVCYIPELSALIGQIDSPPRRRSDSPGLVADHHVVQHG